jgi:hypothetical protein
MSEPGQGYASVADSDPFDTDPDPAFNFDTDPDSAFHFDTDPDPDFHLDTDLDHAFQFDTDPTDCLIWVRIRLFYTDQTLLYGSGSLPVERGTVMYLKQYRTFLYLLDFSCQ